jgi:TRAP-type C4-dicarboxylate transport system permease small subunit
MSSNPRHSWLDLALGAAASVLLLLMVFLTFADVLGRYLFSAPVKGAFELTELSLLVLIFAGLPLASKGDEHVTMDFIDKILSEKAQELLQRFMHLFSAALILGLSYQIYLKAGKIAAYADTTDVLKVPVAPFVYFMTLMVFVTGLIHVFKAFGTITLSGDAFDPEKSATT